MVSIYKNEPPSNSEIDMFLGSINFQLSSAFIDFYRDTNGADISTDSAYLIMWPLTDLMDLNEKYNVATYAPGFFIFGSNGGGSAYAIEIKTGNIFEMPFIGMSSDEAIFRNKSFSEFIKSFLNDH